MSHFVDGLYRPPSLDANDFACSRITLLQQTGKGKDSLALARQANFEST
ncbi:MAG: hypothetical protein IT364_02690 [Candidatus Hydrogenedentes bacterium]|nr:hypothetical protein [Candidatus Hydrogenedentota bacterium]